MKFTKILLEVTHEEKALLKKIREFQDLKNYSEVLNFLLTFYMKTSKIVASFLEKDIK